MIFVEDVEVDAPLLVRELERGGFAPNYVRIETAQGLQSALDTQEWDLIVSDYSLPSFSGLDALLLLQRSGCDIPFLLVSGTIGEEVAVDAMKAGAHDYIMKGNLTRLVPAVWRELREAEERSARRKAEESLRLLEKAVETLPLGVTICDLAGKILYANQAEADMNGYPVAELLGRDARMFAPEDLWETLSPQALTMMTSSTREAVNVRAGRGLLPVQVMSTVVRDDGGAPIALVSVREDISERKKAEAALKESEERYALAAQGASDGLWDWKLKRGEMFFSPRWKLMLGFSEDEIGSSPSEWLDRVHSADRLRVDREIENHLQGLTTHFQSEHRLLHKSGRHLWFLSRGLAVRDATGEVYRMAGSQTNITERKEAEEQLLQHAFYDPLTGVPNRALFLDRLQGAIARARRTPGYQFAVLFLDLDRFKNVNDSLGHTVGDELLVAIARRLEECLRPSDTVARLGGDEFIILADHIQGIEGAREVAGRIQNRLALPFVLRNQEVFISASIGIAQGLDGAERPEDLLRDADTAMYHAKALGKARHVVFDSAMHIRAVSVLQVENDLRRAIERGELRAFYQPIISLTTGRIIAFEALARWQQPQRGFILPDQFIPIAEETGLILSIGQWVLREACRQMRAWAEAGLLSGPLAISVNLSPKQLAHPDLIVEVDRVLEETGLAPSELTLEITESAIMENAEAATAILLELRERGVHLHIDDFGTGYSSFSYLRRLPIDTLKIDRSFVSRMNAHDEDVEIVRTIVTLAHSLGMQVMGEGIEEESQLAKLRSLKCDSGQGFLFSPPLDAAAAGAFIARDPRW